MGISDAVMRFGALRAAGTSSMKTRRASMGSRLYRCDASKTGTVAQNLRNDDRRQALADGSNDN
ncbi:MAG: hypothetical protein CFE29_13845 [Bradyrhizobiaceae bacterium PARB1]|nr:MAG: hypothetical protein CFE29_13845 [Bradyrhizobiaceae bacterium PARB1]